MPSETLSSIETCTSVTFPAAGAGTSIVALSDSSVTSGSSGATLSPACTWISITGTSREVADVGHLHLHQRSTRLRSASSLERCVTNRAAAAPSTTRWS